MMTLQQLRRTLGIDLSMSSAINPFTGETTATIDTKGFVATPLPPGDLTALIDPVLGIGVILLVIWAMMDFITGLGLGGNRRRAL